MSELKARLTGENHAPKETRGRVGTGILETGSWTQGLNKGSDHLRGSFPCGGPEFISIELLESL